MMDDQDITDQALIQAARRRLLEEIGQRKEVEKIVNNVYGGGVGGGLTDKMGQEGGGGGSPEDMDYFVDILRQNYEPGQEADTIDPETGMPIKQKMGSGGWSKRVHRFAAPKKKGPQGMK